MGRKQQLKIAIQLLTAVMSYVTLVWIMAGVVAFAEERHVTDPLIVFSCVHVMAILSLMILVLALVRYPYAMLAFLVTNALFVIGTIVLLALIWSKTLGYTAYKRLSDWPLVQVVVIWELIVAVILEVLVEFKIRTLTGWSFLKHHSNSSANTPAAKPASDAKTPVTHLAPEPAVRTDVGQTAAADHGIRDQVMHGLIDHGMMEVKSDPHYM